jgi:hypothetical protein
MTNDALPQRTFTALLDELIPARDASLPGAGSLGVGEAIEPKLGDASALVASGLAALDAEAREQGATDFADLAPEDRTPLVGEVAAAHPGFIELLVYHTYTTYYQHPRVAVAIGLKPDPPYPGGYELELGDLDALDAVRQRGKMYRDA